MEHKQTRYCESCRSALSENSPSHHYLCRQCFGKKFGFRRNKRRVITVQSETFANPYGREKTSQTAGQCQNCLTPLGENYIKRGFDLCYPCWRSKLNNDSKLAVIRARNERKTIKIRYYSRSSNETSIREIDPETIYVGYNGVEYFDGFCHSRGAKRTFRIDRIREFLGSSRRLEPTLEKGPNETGSVRVRRELGSSANSHHTSQSQNQSIHTPLLGIEHVVAILAAGLVIIALLL